MRRSISRRVAGALCAFASSAFYFPPGRPGLSRNGSRSRFIVSEETVKSYYDSRISKQEHRVEPDRVKDYKSQFTRHILPTKIDGVSFWRLYLIQLRVSHLEKLQTHLLSKGLKAKSVNSIVHGALTAMLKDARRTGRYKSTCLIVISSNPFR
jgi:hypothetical protein